MKSGEQNTFLSLAAANVHHRVEQIGATLATLEWFGDQLIVIGQMSPEKTKKKRISANIKSGRIYKLELEVTQLATFNGPVIFALIYI